MASEILGLFGGQNPQQLRNAALDSMLISPAQMGSQGLLQQVVSMGQNAGTIAGMGAGRLMGGKVAGEVEASYLEQAIQAGQAGKTPTEKMELVASFLEDKPGMGAQYMKALSEARRLKAEDFTMTQAKEKATTRTVKRQVDQFDPYTGKVIGQRTADITQFDTGMKDDKGRIIWEDLEQQDRTTKPPPAAAAGASSAQEQAKAALAKLNATPSAPPADNTLGGVIDAVEAKADMAPLNREADIERAGYNSAAAQVAQQDQRIKKMSDVQRLTPNLIRMIEASDARRIFKDNFEFLSDDQKRELRKRIAKGDSRPPRRPPAAPGDLSGSRLL
jgi:hypothetical protein